MKKLLSYMLGAALLLGATACDKEAASVEAGEGVVRFGISCLPDAVRAVAETPQAYTIRIYNADNGLIRRFDADNTMPEALYLLAGDYTIDVEAGDPTNTAFRYTTDEERNAQLYYKTVPAVSFSIEAGVEKSVQVIVPTQHVAATVCFDPAAAENRHLQNVQIEVIATTESSIANSEAFDKAAAKSPRLQFGALIDENEQSGCLLPPAEAKHLFYRFTAADGTKPVTKIDAITADLQPNKHYTTRFNYAVSDGYLDIEIQTVTEGMDSFHDHFGIRTEPTIAGDGFNIGDPQPYAAGNSVSFVCTAYPTINTIELDGTEIYAGGRATYAIPYVSIEQISAKEVIVTLEPSWFDPKPNIGGEAVLTINGKSYTYSFSKQTGLLEVTRRYYDLWNNTATFRAIVPDDLNPETVQFRFRRQGAADWIELEAEVQGNMLYEAICTPRWHEQTNSTGQTVYAPDPDTGIFADNTYEYALWVNGTQEGETMTFTTTTTQTIPYGDLEDANLACWKTDTKSTNWESGNNGAADGLCKQQTFNGQQGNFCARLKASSNMLSTLASGNLFFGTFVQSGFNGTVSFGQSYDWTARPTSLKLKYWALIGNVTHNKHNTIIPMNSPDQASIYVAIVDWDRPHDVTSGATIVKGVWSAEDGSNPIDSDGKPVGTIIGYGTYYPTGITNGTSENDGEMIELEIPLYYYDTETKPSKSYTLVIGCSTSRYGDWMNGCSTNVMYLDDFRWGYDPVTE